MHERNDQGPSLHPTYSFVACLSRSTIGTMHPFRDREFTSQGGGYQLRHTVPLILYANPQRSFDDSMLRSKLQKKNEKKGVLSPRQRTAVEATLTRSFFVATPHDRVTEKRETAHPYPPRSPPPSCFLWKQPRLITKSRHSTPSSTSNNIRTRCRNSPQKRFKDVANPSRDSPITSQPFVYSASSVCLVCEKPTCSTPAC